jgi:hypothetical protein
MSTYTLKMEAAYYSETYVPVYKTTLHHIEETEIFLIKVRNSQI